MSAEPEKPDPAPSPFELDAPRPAPARSLPGDAPEVDSVPVPVAGHASREYEQALRERADREDKPEVDARTLEEKLGRAPVRAAGVLPPPLHWPLEVLRYPFRGHGPGYLMGATVGLFALDLLLWADSLVFLSWLLKPVALLFVVRWQLDLIGHTAAGRDEPSGWAHALEVHKQGVKDFGWLVIQCFATVLPTLALRTLRWLNWTQHTEAWEVGFLVVGSAWISVLALSSALEDSRLKRPWVTLSWIFYRPLTCLAGSLGWWALGITEVAVLALAKSGTWASVPAGLVLRGASVYMLLLSARILGVLGRRWDPGRLRPA